MTPQEKAIELLEKLIPHVYNEYDGSDGGRNFNAKRHTIQCALIAVEFARQQFELHCCAEIGTDGTPNDHFDRLKTELEKMMPRSTRI